MRLRGIVEPLWHNVERGRPELDGRVLRAAVDDRCGGVVERSGAADCGLLEVAQTVAPALDVEHVALVQ